MDEDLGSRVLPPAMTPARAGSRRWPPAGIRWGVFAMILDVAALLHGAILIWIVLMYNRYWAGWVSWDEPRKYDFFDVGTEFMPILWYLVLTWVIVITAASFAWIRMLGKASSVGRRHAV